MTVNRIFRHVTLNLPFERCESIRSGAQTMIQVEVAPVTDEQQEQHRIEAKVRLIRDLK